MIYAVIDTNVLVSALITHNSESATAKVVRGLLQQDFVPMYDEDIIAEYAEVLHRAKFHIRQDVADALIAHIVEFGIKASRIDYQGCRQLMARLGGSIELLDNSRTSYITTFRLQLPVAVN